MRTEIQAAVTSDEKEYATAEWSATGETVRTLVDRHTIHLEGPGLELTLFDYAPLPDFDPQRPVIVTIHQEHPAS